MTILSSAWPLHSLPMAFALGEEVFSLLHHKEVLCHDSFQHPLC